jgi:hypothetical protein
MFHSLARKLKQDRFAPHVDREVEDGGTVREKA